MRIAPLTVGTAMLLVVLAGCIDSGEATLQGAADDAAAGQDTMDDMESFVLEDCIEQAAIFTFPAEQADPYLPDGFTATGLDGGPLPGRATFIPLLLRCATDLDTDDVTLLFNFIVVEPPEAYKDPDAALHYIPVSGVTTSANLSARFAAWNVTAVPRGELAFDGEPDGPGVETWTMEALTDDGGARLTTNALGDHPELVDGSIRVFGVEARTVVGIVDMSGGAWEGGVGDAVFEDDGMVPFDLAAVGVGVHAWDYGFTVAPAPLP